MKSTLQSKLGALALSALLLFATVPTVGCSGVTVAQDIVNWTPTIISAAQTIDATVATLDPANPTNFLPAFDHGDHLHPNDAGYKAMGDAIDLKLFQSK